jgi:pre-mRNA cleavage complex 2 protein Pcf11
MQTILDDLQSDVQDELEKVSLERLASIDPDLLVKIKRTAEDSLRNGGMVSDGGPAKPAPEVEETLSFLLDPRSEAALKSAKAWENAKIDPLKESHDIIAGLRHIVIELSKPDKTYTQKEAIGMTNTLGAAGAMAGVLTATLERLRDDEKKAKAVASSDGARKIGSSGAVSRGFFAIDKSLFTSEGLKKKNMAVVGMLYEIGLPFPSAADGRRFATQWELSNHLDALFKKKYVRSFGWIVVVEAYGYDSDYWWFDLTHRTKFLDHSQLEKTIARTEERGWYVSDSVWSGESKESEGTRMPVESMDKYSSLSHTSTDAEMDPSSIVVPADESRDRCVICGINFTMFFENDEGIYMYSNCREIEVLNDEAAAEEKQDLLVHVSCWRALGAPECLTVDQTLHDSL